MTRKALLPAAVFALAACDGGGTGGDSQADAPADAGVMARAEQMAQRHLVVDGHIDVPYRLKNRFEDVTGAAPMGDFDYPRAKTGGLDAPFMSIYTPAEYEFQREGKATAHANLMIDLVEGLAERAPEKFTIATSPEAVEAAKAEDKIALALGMENGAPIAGELGKLHHFYERGIRYITMAHARSNHLADSSYDEERPNGGLSDFGVEAVAEMNALGVMVDISHLTDKAIDDVLETTKAPVVATHSSARHFTPGWERNLPDDLIKAVGENGGVVMIAFGSAFLTEEANSYGDKAEAAYESWREERGKPADADVQAAFETAYRARNPYPYADLEDVLDHIDHVARLAGIEHVGIGSDYDGVGSTLPTGLKDVATYPNLVAGLLERGYTEAEIKKILGGNLMRVWRQVESVAAEIDGETEQDGDGA